MAWVQPGRGSYYRSLPYGANYPPDSAYAGGDGRFDDGERKTLYVSTTATAAVAEFFRARSSLLPIQDVVPVRLVSLDLEVVGSLMDVTDPVDAAAMGMAPDRLVSNDADREVRFAECRSFAVEVEDSGGVGVRYPCAAHITHDPNVVVFGDPDPATWTVHAMEDVQAPPVAPSEVVVADND